MPKERVVEFLATYGWAFLVVIAAIVALAYLGLLKPEAFLPDQIPNHACCENICSSMNGSCAIFDPSRDTITCKLGHPELTFKIEFTLSNATKTCKSFGAE
jgi:hypothetical protein